MKTGCLCPPGSGGSFEAIRVVNSARIRYPSMPEGSDRARSVTKVLILSRNSLINSSPTGLGRVARGNGQDLCHADPPEGRPRRRIVSGTVLRMPRLAPSPTLAKSFVAGEISPAGTDLTSVGGCLGRPCPTAGSKPRKCAGSGPRRLASSTVRQAFASLPGERRRPATLHQSSGSAGRVLGSPNVIQPGPVGGALLHRPTQEG